MYGDINLEIVNKCNYLGIVFTPDGSFSEAQATLSADLGPNTLKSIQIHYNYFDLSMITITLQLQDL